MNNIGKPALHGLTEPTVGTFFVENHLKQTTMTNFILKKYYESAVTF
jgi:hypothetical protein